MFVVPKNVEELRRLVESDTPVLAFAFRRHGPEDWAPEHSHARGQLFALTRGLLIVEAGNERWMFPPQRCAWIPPEFIHSARSVGGASGSMVFLSAETCRGLPKKPCMFSSSVHQSCYFPSSIVFSHETHGNHSARRRNIWLRFFGMRFANPNNSLFVYLIGPMRPTRRRIALSPQGGLYAMPSLCVQMATPRRPASGSVLSLLFFVDMSPSKTPESPSLA